MRLLLGLDIGTTAMKTALYDEKGNLLALSTQEYTLITPEIIVCCVQIEFYRKPASIHHWLFSQLTVSEPNLSDSMTSPL